MVREYKISNVILFRENITDCAQLKQLCGEIQALVRRETGHGAFITADQEGGLVTRLPVDAVNVPGAMAIAATGDPENASFSTLPPVWTSIPTRKIRSSVREATATRRRRSPVTPTG